MSKVNIANYVVYDLVNRFNFVEHHDMDREIAGLVADQWSKKHFVSGSKGIKFKHDDRLEKKFLI